jgi:glutathione S-transferase
MNKHQLIGAEVSLYTGKLRCYLQYKGIAFGDVLATREIYRDIIIPRTGVRYIPVLITDDGQALQDTTVIIDALEQRYPQRGVYPTAPLQRLIAVLLETYADEWLVMPAMHYRWSFAENRDFAIREFGRTSAPDASAEEQWAIGEETSKPFASALPKLGVNADNSAAIETSYLALLKDLHHHFAHYPFLLGDKPCIGDFGLIGPLYAHLYRDPYSGRVLSETAPQVEAWIQRMLDPISHRHTAESDFLADDQLPNTLLPVLTRMFKEQGPVLLQTITQVKDWANNNAQAPLPRVIGECRFTVEGVAATRLTFPYMQWMWQRCADAYQQLNTNDRLRVDAWLSAVPNAVELLNTPIAQRVGRENNRVVLGS